MSIARFFLCNPNNEYFKGDFCLDRHSGVLRCSVVDMTDMVIQDVPVSDLLRVDVSLLSAKPLMCGSPLKAQVDFRSLGGAFRVGDHHDVSLDSTSVRFVENKVFMNWDECFLRVNAITKCLDAVCASGIVHLLNFRERGYAMHFCFAYRLEGYLVLCYQLIRIDYGSRRYVTSVSAAYDINETDFKGFWLYGSVEGIQVLASNRMMPELQYEAYKRNQVV